MRAELHFKSAAPRDMADNCLRILGRELQRARPSSFEANGNTITVRGGAFRMVWNWNLLVSITSATFVAEPDSEGVTLRYAASMTELIVVCACFSLIFGFVIASTQRSILAAIITGLLLPWGWIFGMNYVIAKTRFARLLSRVAAEAADGNSQHPDAA